MTHGGAISDSNRIVAIVNSTSRVTAQRWRSASSAIPDHVGIIDASESMRIEDLTRNAIDLGAEQVIAVGGDGTVHAVVNGILSRPESQATLGVLPLGSANDFAYGLKVAFQHGAARSHWDGTLLADIGLVVAGDRRRYFCNVMGVGFTACVARRAESLEL